MRLLPPLVSAVAALALLGACQGEAAELTTTSSLVASPTTIPGSSTTSAPTPEETTTTTLSGQPVDDYDIVARASSPEGETLYIVVPSGAYTDVDVEDFVIALVEEEVATYGAEIFDDPAAVDAYLRPEEERTEEDQALIDEHHLASLIEANRIRFRGPFQSLGETVIGS